MEARPSSLTAATSLTASPECLQASWASCFHALLLLTPAIDEDAVFLALQSHGARWLLGLAVVASVTGRAHGFEDRIVVLVIMVNMRCLQVNHIRVARSWRTYNGPVRYQAHFTHPPGALF